MMLLQIYFEVSDEKASDFDKMYIDDYVPALRKQQGYLRSDLLRIFPADIAAEIETASTPFNYQMELVFDTEANRRRWVDSAEHGTAWETASGMAKNVAWRAYDVVGSDANT